MERTEILSKLNEIFIEILDLDECDLNEHTNAGDIEEWDSLAQIQLVVAIEKEFGIKFTAQEINSWQDVGAMMNTIISKL